MSLFLFIYFGFLRQGFSVVLEPALKLALVDHIGLKLTEIGLPLPPQVLGLKATLEITGIPPEKHQVHDQEASPHTPTVPGP